MLTSEVAKLLDAAGTTVRDLERRGLLHATRTTRGVRLFRREDVEQLLAEQLGTVLFPERVTFDGWEMQTPLSAFQGNDLRELSSGNSGLVDQRGFEPLTS